MERAFRRTGTLSYVVISTSRKPVRILSRESGRGPALVYVTHRDDPVAVPVAVPAPQPAPPPVTAPIEVTTPFSAGVPVGDLPG